MAQSTKIMLVEDDNNLGEIYMARMAAEGYSVVVAHDGEEALALAAKEKPDLIISDVMMPKISGFEMLDILRNTPGLRDTKVIMLTALGQAEDKTRAQALGADRYLVKSQVTLEDIVENARALLSGDSAAAAPAAAAEQPAAPQPAPAAAAPAAVPEIQTIVPAQPAVPAVPSAPTPEPVTDAIPVATPPAAAAEPALPVDPPAPIAVAPIPAAPPAANGLAQPLSSNTVAANDPPKTAPIADIVAASESVQPAPIPVTSAPTQVPLAAQPPVPVQQTPVPPAAPELPKSDTTVNETNDKVLTGAVDELLANAPKAAPAPAPTPAPAAPATNNAVPDNKPTEHSSKILDDGGNELAVGDTASTRVSGKKIIAPISDVSKKPDLNALLANEEAKAAGPDSNPVAPGITTSTNGVQTTVVMPSGGNNISGVSAPAAVNAPANLQEPQTPGQNNPNVTNPASTNSPGASFDPSSVAL